MNEISKEEKRRLKAIQKNKINDLTQEPITVLCVKFGIKYGRNYVERLRNMVARHLTVPYQFVCLTDSNLPIDGVKLIVQPNAEYAKPWWHKIHMFDPSLPIIGRILYLDLDVVIHNNLNKLVTDQTHSFFGIKDFNRKFHKDWNNLNSSVLCWDHGTQSHIWDQFLKNKEEALRLHGDQDWIWRTSKDRIKFWPTKWIQSYKWEIRDREELTLIQGKRKFKEIKDNVEPPSDCCIMVFHGDPKPQDVEDKIVVDNWR